MAAAGVTVYAYLHRLHDGSICLIGLADELLSNVQVASDLTASARWWDHAKIDWGSFQLATNHSKLVNGLLARDTSIDVPPSMAGSVTSTVLLADGIQWKGRIPFPVLNVTKRLVTAAGLSPVNIQRAFAPGSTLSALQQVKSDRLAWSSGNLKVKLVHRKRGVLRADATRLNSISRYRPSEYGDVHAVSIQTKALVCVSQGTVSAVSDSHLEWMLNNATESVDDFTARLRTVVGSKGMIELRLCWRLAVDADRLAAIRATTDATRQSLAALDFSATDLTLISMGEGSAVLQRRPSWQQTVVLLLDQVIGNAAVVEDVVLHRQLGDLTGREDVLDSLRNHQQLRLGLASDHGLATTVLLRIRTDRLMIEHGLTSGSLPMDIDVSQAQILAVLEDPAWYSCDPVA